MRRLLPYTSLVVLAAAIYAIMTMRSRYASERDFELRTIESAKEKEAATNQRTVDTYGGDKLTILAFAAEPGVVSPGEAVHMCYGVNNATAVKIEPDAPPIKPALTHCFDIRPKRTTTYTLTAEDAHGNRKQGSITIRVR